MDENSPELRLHDLSFKSKVHIIEIEKLHFNPYNCNKMDDYTYSLLKNEVKKNNYDPIIISPRSRYENNNVAEYIVLDGEHRTKCALELDQTHMRCFIHPLSEEAALPYYYKRQTIHGSTDPLRESKLFNHERSRGYTSKEIAERYGLSDAHVKYRQTLVNICPYVLEKYVEGLLSVSHLEVLASESEENQIFLSDEAVKMDLSVRELASLKRDKPPYSSNIKGGPYPKPMSKYVYSLTIETTNPLLNINKKRIITAIKKTIDKEDLVHFLEDKKS